MCVCLRGLTYIQTASKVRSGGLYKLRVSFLMLERKSITDSGFFKECTEVQRLGVRVPF